MSLAPHNYPMEDLMPTDDRMILYPFKHLFAIIDDPDSSEAALGEIHAAGFAPAGTWVLTGDPGAARIDPSGRSHGILGRIWRGVQFATMDALPDAGRYAAAAEEGRFVFAIRAENEFERSKLVEILERHGGHFINYYGKLTTTELRP